MIVCLSIKQEAYQLSSFAAALGYPRGSARLVHGQAKNILTPMGTGGKDVACAPTDSISQVDPREPSHIDYP